MGDCGPMADLSLKAQVMLELDLRRNPPLGGLVLPGGGLRPFSGWIELTSAIESWRVDAVARFEDPDRPKRKDDQ